MASITIRNLDAATKARLRLEAARNDRSMEEEARSILRTALASAQPDSAPGFGERIRRRFAKLGGIELTLPERGPIRRPPGPSR
jgi:plasmid stability protein